MNKLPNWSFVRTNLWNLFREMQAIQDRIDRALDPRSNADNPSKDLSWSGWWEPLVDVTEDDDEFLIKAELPEVKKEDVKVSLDNGVLTITGHRNHEHEHEQEHEKKTRKRHRIERNYGRFERCFALPDLAKGTKVSAELKDGVLNVHLPKDPTHQS